MQRIIVSLPLCALLLAHSIQAQIVGPADHIVGSIPLPGTVQGDVVVTGTAVIVGQGSFGAGLQSIIRRDWDGTVTTLATGFNSLGNFAATADGAHLFVTDNGGELIGAVTGDTLFVLDDPRTASSPVTSSGREVAAPGSIPFAQSIAIGPDGQPYVGDAAGGTDGTILRRHPFLYGPLATHAAGFGYTAGLAFGVDGHLFVGDVDGFTFAGRVVELDAAGSFVGDLATGLSGALDLAFARDGRLLVSGGFTGDFSSSTVVAIDDSGVVTELAHGFGFSTGMDVDPVSGRIHVLDFGASAITTFTPVSALLPGGGGSATDCYAQFSDVPQILNRRGLPTTTSECRDGSSCDRDGVADGVCTFGLGVCLNVGGNPRCNPVQVDSFSITPIAGVVDPQVAALGSAVAAVLPSTAAECVGPAPVTVALRQTPTGPKPATKLVRTSATYNPPTGRPKKDADRLVLRCLP